MNYFSIMSEEWVSSLAGKHAKATGQDSVGTWQGREKGKEGCSLADSGFQKWVERLASQSFHAAFYLLSVAVHSLGSKAGSPVSAENSALR